MKQNHLNRNFWIGLTTVLALFLFYFGFSFLKGKNVFDKTETYYVLLANTGGLSRATPVVINGFEVGKVSELEFNYNNMMASVASLSVNRDLKIPKGTLSYVESNPLGGARLILEVSDEKNYYEPGDTILSQVKTGIMEEIQDIIAPKISDTLDTLDSLIGSIKGVVNDPHITSTLADLASSAKSIRTTSNHLNQYMAKDVPSILERIDSATYSINQIVAAVPASEIEASILEFKTVVSNLKAVSNQLKSDSSSLGLLLNDPKLYEQLQSAVTSADSLLTDIKENPKRYLDISVF